MYRHQWKLLSTSALLLIWKAVLLEAINNVNGHSPASLTSSSDLCPSMCICDAYKKQNRAKCSNQKLINANVGMPIFVEILDLSHNDITAIDNKCFSTLERIVQLQIDRNSIDSIDLDAFSSLRELKYLSLAHNRLETFDKRIVEQNLKLISLNLAGNNFMNLQNAPILYSPSLQELDLRESKLSHLQTLFFKELPNLKMIDLAKNLLITINVAAFERNFHLEQIKIDGNPFTCDLQMEMTLLLLKRKNIKARLKYCPVPRVRQMFERMQMLPSLEEHSATSASNSQARRLNVTTIWRNTNYSRPILNEICPLNDTDKACDLFETCALEYSMLLKESEEKLSHKRPINYEMEQNQNWLHSITINIAFYAGLCLGSIFGGSCIFICGTICSKGCKSRKDLDRESRRRYRGRPVREDYRPPRERTHRPDPIPLPPATPQTPVSPSPTTDNQEIVEYRAAAQRRRPQDTFFSLLFDRPVRRRYYRQLNQNATNLVRRLSQSRLFLNSSRSARAANRRSDSESAATPTEATTPTEAPTNVRTEPPRHTINRQMSAPASSTIHSIYTPTTSTPANFLHCYADRTPDVRSSTGTLPSMGFVMREDMEPTAPLTMSSDEDGYTSEPDVMHRGETPPPAYHEILPDTSSLYERQSM